MKITEVRTIPLSGGTHDTGWPGGKEPDEQMNTLVEVKTDEGLTGIGSCFTSHIEDIIDPPFRLDADGMLRIPTGPGLGVRLNRDALARYTR